MRFALLPVTVAIMVPAAQASPLFNSENYKPPVRNAPIAGVYNSMWFNYLADVQEAEKELASDLRHSTDDEDRRDAWEEYRDELVDADRDYVKEMRERGYRAAVVTVG